MTGASSVGFDRRPCSTIGSQPCNTLSSKLLPKKRSSKVAAPIKISHVVVNPGSLGLDTGWDLLQPTSRSKGPLIWLRTSPFSQQAPPSLTQAAAETGRNAHGDAESSASSRSRRSAPSCRRISPPPPRSPSPPMSAPHKDPARKLGRRNRAKQLPQLSTSVVWSSSTTPHTRSQYQIAKRSCMFQHGFLCGDEAFWLIFLEEPITEKPL